VTQRDVTVTAPDAETEAEAEVKRLRTLVRAAAAFPAGQAHFALGYVEGKAREAAAADEDLREGVRILRMQLPASQSRATPKASDPRRI
jgi:hypothetical protein